MMRRYATYGIVGFLVIYFFSISPNALSAGDFSGDEVAAAVSGSKRIALTFDDGPRPQVLQELLPLLHQYGAHASFFVNGWAVVENASWIARVHAEGHRVENHTYGHENLKKSYAAGGAEAVRRTVARTGEAITKAAGRAPRFFRPPFWEITPEIERIIVDMGYRVVKIGNPDINTMDYDDVEKKRPASVLIERVKKQIADREKEGKSDHVLVMHERALGVEALRTLLPYFKDRGYSFVLLDELYK